MITDRLLHFTEAANGFANSGVTANVGSALDLGAARDIATGKEVYVCIIVTTAFVGSGASIEVKVVSDATSSIAVDGSATLHATFGVKAISNTAFNAVGKRFFIRLPSGDFEQYLGVQVTSTGANTTAGALRAFVTFDEPRWLAYPEAVS